MNARVYANTTSLSLTADLDGGDFVPPVILAYQDIFLRFRLAREIEGVGVPDRRAIRAVSLRMGRPGRPPESGTYQLEIGVGATKATTADIAWDATATAVAAAINAAIETPLASLHPCSVTEYLGIKRVTFADQSAHPDIVCVDNALWPLSFVNVDAMEWDGGWAWMLSLEQTSAAEATGAYETVPSAPSFVRIQAGQEVDGYLINEIQKLSLPPDFTGGAIQLTFAGRKSSPMPVPPTLEQVDEALQELVTAGEAMVVSEAPGGAYVEFQGDFEGEGQDLIGVDVFESPGVEYLVRLPTRKAGVRLLMLGANEDGLIEVPLNLDFEIEDPETPGQWERKMIPMEVTLRRPVSAGDRNVTADLRWDQPLSRGDYQRHSTDAILIGSRAMRFTIGDGSSTSFPLAHNLGSAAAVFTASAATDKLSSPDHNFQDLDPITAESEGTLPAPLVAGTVYFVRDATTDDYKVSLTPNGDAIDLTSAGSGTHTARLKDGTIDGVMVEIWETAGDEARVPQSDYTVERTSADAVTVSGFSAPPTAGQYEVLVMAYGRPATFQGHAHGIDDTPEAKARIEALEARVAALEAGDFGGPAPALSSRIAGQMVRTLPRVWSVPRARKVPEDPGTLTGWNAFAEGSPLRDLRLLPAVHVAAGAVETLPSTLPTPAATYRDRVFYAATDREDVPGGLRAGQHAACDGREWYRVARESAAESTWYPTVFGLECFRLSVSPDELALRTRLDLGLGLELVLADPSRRPLDRRTVARMSLLLERGVRTEKAAPAGSNIDAHFSDAVVLARHDFDLTQTVVQKRFTLSIARAGDGTLTALAGKFLGALVTVSPPATADFSLRLRLARVDFQQMPTDARGVLAVRGLDVGLDGAPDTTLGRLIIS